MITRRKLLTTAAATGAASILLPTMQAPAENAPVCAVKSGAESTTGLISLTAPTDPTYKSLLNTHFPNLDEDPNLSKVQFSAMLITNTSGTDINAFSTFWSCASSFLSSERKARAYSPLWNRRESNAIYGADPGDQSRSNQTSIALL